MIFTIPDAIHVFREKGASFNAYWKIPRRHPWSVAQNPDGHYFFSGEDKGVINVWDTVNKIHLTTWNTNQNLPVTELAISYDEQYFAYSINKEKVGIRNLNKQITKEIPTPVDGFDSLQGRLLKFSPVNNCLVIAHENSIFISNLVILY